MHRVKILELIVDEQLVESLVGKVRLADQKLVFPRWEVLVKDAETTWAASCGQRCCASALQMETD